MSSKLLGLPAELRIRIYAFVIGGSPASVLVEANGCYHRILECSLGPLFAISQQIREEASPRLRCTLSIYRENPVAFDETTLTAPFDNYRSTLSVLVRSSTSIIVIASTAGVREQFFNNKQFPNLELLIVDCPVTMRRDVNLGTARGAKGHLTLDREPAIVPLPPNATADRIMHGKYDANFFNAARRRVGRTTIWEVFPGAWERRFAIHCRARASIWWADRTHIRKKIIGFANIEYDYDTGEVVARDYCWNPDCRCNYSNEFSNKFFGCPLPENHQSLDDLLQQHGSGTTYRRAWQTVYTSLP